MTFISRPFAPIVDMIILLPAAQFEKSGGWLTFDGRNKAEKRKPYTIGELQQTVLRELSTDVPASVLALAARSGRLDLRSSGNLDLSLFLSGFLDQFDALGKCAADVARRLGISANWTIPPEPTEEMRYLFRASDYPTDLIRLGKSGRVVALLRVGAKGRVTGCTGYEVTGDRRFEAITCNVLSKRARFKPAKTADGTPVESYFVTEEVRYDISD